MSWFSPSTKAPKPTPITKTAAMKNGQTNATATAAQPRLTMPVAIITVTRAGSFSIVRIAISTPRRPPAKWTLMVAPATGRLTPKRRVRCSSSGPYAATMRPMKRKVTPTAMTAVLERTRPSERELRNASHRVVVAVKGLLSEDGVARLVLTSSQQGQKRPALETWRRGHLRSLEERRQGVEVADELRACAICRNGPGPRDEERHLEAGIVEGALRAGHGQSVVRRVNDQGALGPP